MPRLQINLNPAPPSQTPSHHSHSHTHSHSRSVDEKDNNSTDPVEAARRRSSDADSTNSYSSGSDIEFDDDEEYVGYYGRRPSINPVSSRDANMLMATGSTDSMPTLRPDMHTMRPGGGGRGAGSASSSYRNAPASMDDVRRAIEESNAAALRSKSQLSMSVGNGTSSSPPPVNEMASLALSSSSFMSTSASVPMGASSSNPSSLSGATVRTPWTGDDSHLEILSRLGEGASGAVFKVRDVRGPPLRRPSLISQSSSILSPQIQTQTSKPLIMALKVIPATGATNPKALLHEYRSLSNSMHVNITTFYGAYVGSTGPARGRAPSESSSGPMTGSSGSSGSSNNVTGLGRSGAPEICLLMEYCEGGSLDAVARRIKQMGSGARVSEKVMGKIADGVLRGLDYLHSQKVVHRGEF